MGFVGGDIVEANCVHPTLGTFRYETKTGEAFTSDSGGLRNDDSDDNVTASGIMIVKKKMVMWSFDGSIVVDIKADTQVGSLKAMAASADPGVWTFTHISGSVSTGTGMPVGDLKVDTNTAMLKLKIAGGGDLQQIA
jgi:hypothetical protein